MLLTQSRDLVDFIPLLQELDFGVGDKFSLSMLHWCGIGQRAYPLAFWEVYIAIANQQAIGVTGLYRQMHTPSQIVWVGWFGVRPNYRRRGFASIMMDELKDLARGFNFKELWVFTEPDNEAALGCYRKAGFIEVDTSKEEVPGTTHEPSDVKLKFLL